MPVVFNASKRLEHAEYIHRRDTTTKEELSKLKQSPEFRKWEGKSKNLQNGAIKGAALIAIITILSIGYCSLSSRSSIETHNQGSISPVESQQELTVTSMPTTPLQSSSHAQWMLIFEEELSCFKERADIQKELSFLSRQLNTTRNELSLAMNNNIELTLKLSEQQQPTATQTHDGNNITSTTTNLLFNDTVAIITSLTVTAIASLLYTIIQTFYSKKKTAFFTNSIQTLTSQLQEALFDKETTEQSVSILEQELQRKMKQLDEAKDQLVSAQKSKQQKHHHNHHNQDGSPRIPAAMHSHGDNISNNNTTTTTMQDNNDDTNTTTTNTMTSPCTPGTLIHTSTTNTNNNTLTPPSSSRQLPPPPKMLVERFLQERRAVAIEEDQVHAWLQMESDFGRLLREVNQLRSAVQSRDADAQAIEVLSSALEEQRVMARRAKNALKAVRDAAAANGGWSNSGGSGSQIPVV